MLTFPEWAKRPASLLGDLGNISGGIQVIVAVVLLLWSAGVAVTSYFSTTAGLAMLMGVASLAAAFISMAAIAVIRAQNRGTAAPSVTSSTTAVSREASADAKLLERIVALEYSLREINEAVKSTRPLSEHLLNLSQKIVCRNVAARWERQLAGAPFTNDYSDLDKMKQEATTARSIMENILRDFQNTRWRGFLALWNDAESVADDRMHEMHRTGSLPSNISPADLRRYITFDIRRESFLGILKDIQNEYDREFSNDMRVNLSLFDER